MAETRTALLPRWLEPPAIPNLNCVYRDLGEPIPAGDVLTSVTFYVPPYMGPPSEVALAARMPALEVVQALTAGVDGMSELLPDGVELIRAVGVHDDSTAELAVGLMIGAQRGIDIAARDMTTGVWGHERRRSLADSKVAIVGWGGVGRSIAARLTPFAVDMCTFSRSGRDGALSLTLLDESLPAFDIVVLALPHTADTHRFMDARRLALMADGALLVNVGRGPLVDTDALLAETGSGRLRAALDVTDPEPLPPEHPLWRSPGVLVTPHLGGNSRAFVPRARRLVAEQLRRYASGEPLVR